MKRFTLALATLLLVLSTCIFFQVGAVEVPEYTAISTKEDFYNIRENPGGKYYLTADIVFDELDYTIMGDYYGGFSAMYQFSGTLDGCGHTISGIEGQYGIAEYNYGTIKNIEFNACTFANGGVVKVNGGTISNCKVTNSAIGDSAMYSKENIACFATENDYNGIVEYCSTSGCAIYGCAGFVGYNKGTVSNCVNYNNISHEYSVGAAGIVSYNTAQGSISACMNLGAITMSGGDAAGIALDNFGAIENCVNRANISTNAGSRSAAGIACSGSNYIKNCLNTGAITARAKNSAFGISGISNGQNLFCVNMGNVKSNNATGYAISKGEETAFYCYYLDGVGTGAGTAFTAAQMSQTVFANLDFATVWSLESGNLALQCETEFQTAITAYQYPAKTKYWRGNSLDLSDMVVFSLNSKGTWCELYAGEYTVTGYNPKTLGKQTITVSRLNNSFTFNLYVYDNIAKQTTTVNPVQFEYSGQACKPSVSITDSVTRKRLTVGKDYKLTYGNNLNVGSAYVQITGMGYYEGSFKKTFKIIPKDISTAQATVFPNSFTYKGRAIVPTTAITIEGVSLVKDKDYTVTFKNNTNVGTAQVIFKGIGNYKGTIKSSFTIKPCPVSDCTVKLSASSYTYNGKVKTPTVTIQGALGKTLKNGTDYTVSYASGRKTAGKYKVTVKMKGNYSGTKTLTFKINPVKVSRCSVKLSDTSYVYNGKAKTPTVTVKDSAGKTLKKGTDYTVTYAKGRKNVGTFKVTVKMKGNYSGTKTLTFKIVPKAASINKLTAKSKAIVVKLNRSLQQSTGYQIQYSTSSKFTSAKTVTVSSYKTSSQTLSGLKKGKKYFVRVRTYKTVGKTKFYSSWSAYKSVKTK